MELTHAFTVPAEPAATWALLTDLHRVGSCFPGATVTEADAERFAGTVKVKLGPIALTYAGSGTFVERDDDGHRAVIEARGKDRRGNGTASATVTLSLSGDGAGTRVEVLTDLSVTGKPAQFGRGVMQDVSDKLLGQFVACIERQFEPAEPPATPEPAAADPQAPAAAADAEPSTDPTAAATAPDAGPDVDPEPASDAGPEPAADAEPDAGPPPSTPHRASAPATAADGAIDLGSAVLPVLLQRYAGVLLAGLGGFAAGVLAGRAGRR